MLPWNKLPVPISSLSEEELYFIYLLEKGWEEKVIPLVEEDLDKKQMYWDRLLDETRVILKMKFPSYFLIVRDMLKWADENKIRRGAGRGSVGGSMIAWILDITKIDPIRYNLLFSRFLNEDRISMPDIDCDIETDRRDEVKQYLRRKYGEDKVASIGTFGTVKVRSAIKDIVRSLNIGGDKSESFRLADEINNVVPNDEDISFDDACKQSEMFKSYVWYPSEEELENGWGAKIRSGVVPSQYWQVGYHLRKMEGMIRQTGTHAAGVLISPFPLAETLPMAIDKNNVVVTSNSGKTIEDAGFLKIDVLGLKTLSIIKRTLGNINKVRKQEVVRISTLGVPKVEMQESNLAFEERIKDEADPTQQASRAYRLLRSGQTEGVFQCESPVAKQLLKDLQCNSIDDLAAVLALNRPGPLKAGMATEFGDRKFGVIPTPSIHPVVDRVLADTFNILCIAEGQPIYDPIQGINVPIETITSGILLQSCNSNTLSNSLNYTSVLMNNGVKKVSKFRLRTGYEIIATPEHKILSCKGECSLEYAFNNKLSIAIPKSLEVINPNIGTDLDRKKLRILGLLISEGSLSSSTGIAFTTSDPILKADFQQLMSSVYPRCLITKRQGRTPGTERFDISKNMCYYEQSEYHSPNDLLIDLRVWGLKSKDSQSCLEGGCNSYTKFIPKFIFKLDTESKKIFLAALWDGDGSSYSKQNALFYTTCSLQLANDITLLMRQLGILALFAQREDGAYRISIPIGQGEVFTHFCKVQSKIYRESKYKDEHVTQISRDLIFEAIKRHNLGLNRVAEMSGISAGTLTKRKYKNEPIFVSTAIKIAKALNDTILLNMLENYYWVMIEEVESVGEAVVYDISMNDSSMPWFIGGAGGIILHNCYQEQCMQLAVECAGFSLSDSDTLRRAIGKKNQELMNKYEERFIEGCLKKHPGFDKIVQYEVLQEDDMGNPIKVKETGTIAKQVWRSITFFASYGFNKCLAYDELLVDTLGNKYKIEELAGKDCSQIKMFSINEATCEVVENQLIEVFYVGEEEVIEVTFDDGGVTKATSQHQFLCTNNQMHTLEDILTNRRNCLSFTHLVVKVKQVRRLGKMKVYSLEMGHPHHNYILPNGLISKNSHSVGYALTSYQTAFLKANYPAEFWSAQLSYESDIVKINRMLVEVKQQGITVSPVSINISTLGYEVEDRTILRRSLGVLNNVGPAAVEEVLKHRPYSSIEDFMFKINQRKINKRTLESLVSAGAFDEFNRTRKSLFEGLPLYKDNVEKWIKKQLTYYRKAAEVKASVFQSPTELDLIQLADDKTAYSSAFQKDILYSKVLELSKQILNKWNEIKPSITTPEAKDLLAAQNEKIKELINDDWYRGVLSIYRDQYEREIPISLTNTEWDTREIIRKEKEVYGCAVTKHIFDAYEGLEQKVMNRFPSQYFSFSTSSDLIPVGMEVVLLGEVITQDRQIPYKKDPTKFVRVFRLEDRYGSEQITVFDKDYQNFYKTEDGFSIRPLQVGNIVIVKAKKTEFNGRKSLVYQSYIKIIPPHKEEPIPSGNDVKEEIVHSD